MRFLANSYGARAHRLPPKWFGAALMLCVLSAPAFAEDTPFDLEPSSWMSFGRYQEKPTSWTPPEIRAQQATQAVVAPPPVMPPSMPVITTPSHAVAAPVLPGINKGFEVNVDSTEDDKAATIDENDLSKSDMPLDLQSESKQWQDAVEAARQHSLEKKKMAANDDRVKDIRLSYLPKLQSMPKAKVAVAKQTPILKPVPEPKKTEVAEEKPAAPKAAPPKPQPSAADAAACAALENYKKRQLAAIESDRKTLTALQDAISQLGLQNQLDFMVNASTKLNTKAEATSADVPSPTAAPPAANN